VFGSNIANLALVGGLVALIRPLEVKKNTLFREIPVMLAVALLLWPFLYNSYLARPEGAILLVVFAILILITVHIAKREATQTLNEAKNANDNAKQETPHTVRNVLFVIIGLVGLALGAKMAVTGAEVIGKRIGLSDAVIGLTIIALGTSLPELVTCVVAAVKGHHDISVGNLVGSNIFNLLWVLGFTASIVELPFQAVNNTGSAFGIGIGIKQGMKRTPCAGINKVFDPLPYCINTCFFACSGSVSCSENRFGCFANLIFLITYLFRALFGFSLLFIGNRPSQRCHFFKILLHCSAGFLP